MNGTPSSGKTFLELGGNARYLLEKIGTGLIRSVLLGDYGKKEASAFLEARNRFLASQGMDEDSTVEIRLKSHQFRPRPGMRPYLCQKTPASRNFPGTPAHLILCGRGFLPERFFPQKTAPILHFTGTGTEAELLAVTLREELKGYVPETKDPDVTCFDRIGYQECYFPLLPGILYSEIRDPFDERLARERFLFETEILSRISGKDVPYSRIIRWKKTAALGVRELRFFINETFKINKTHPCRYLVMISDNREISKLLQSSASLFPVEMALVESLTEAVHLISTAPESLPELASAEDAPDNNHPAREGVLSLSRTDLQELKHFLMIAHARERTAIEDYVDSLHPEHPLREIYRSFAGYVTQIDELRKSELNRGLLIKREARKFKLLYSLVTDWPSLDPESPTALEFLLNLLLNELDLAAAACLTVEEPLRDRSFTIIKSAIPSKREDTLTGTILPPPLGLYLTSSDISVFTPELILGEVSLREGSLKPWLKAFLLRRKLTSAALFRYGSVEGKNCWLYLERDHEPEDHPFSLFDPLIREVYEILRRRRERPQTTLAASVEPAQQPPFHWDETLEEFGGDRKFLLDLLKLFVSEIPDREKTLQELMAYPSDPDRREALRATLHKIKGAAANLFCEDLRSAVEDFENAVKANCPSAWNRCLERLQQEFRRIESFYKETSLE